MAEDFDFDKAEDEFEDLSLVEELESQTPTLDQAKERGEWESVAERDQALQEATDQYIKEHKGAKVDVVYVGGFYHARLDKLRKPLKLVMEVALPPRETSPGCFTNDVQYQAYYLRVVGGTTFYVYENYLPDFIKNLDKIEDDPMNAWKDI